MIKTIDDLRKCYAVRADKEVFELFMDKCEGFGITWNPESPREVNFGEAVVFDGANSGHLGHQSEPYMIDRNYKRLTLSDFKPTRTKYEKVTESIFDLRDEFERGELYKLRNDDTYEKITCESKLGELYGYRLIYRKVEKEIDWREDADSYFLKTKRLGIDCTIEEAITRSDYCDEFLELCRVAIRANGEIE